MENQSAQPRSLLLRPDTLLFLATAVLYGFTLAPTTFWSDPAQLQTRSLMEWEMSPDARHYPLFTVLARILVHPFAPLSDLALWMNVLNAFFGCITVVLIYRVALTLKASRGAAAVGALSYMVAHTVWQQTVFTEVYSLSTALILAMLLCVLLWKPEKPGYFYGALFLFGFGFFQHRFHILTIPPFLFYLWLRRAEITKRNIQWGLFWLVIGLLPILILSVSYLADGHPLGELIHVYLFSGGKDWEAPITGVDWSRFGEDAFYLLAFFGYNFIGLAILLGVVGAVRSFRQARREAWLIAGFMAMGFAFGFDYNIGEKWIFFIPMYLAFAVWVGIGADWLLDRLAARRTAVLASLIALVIAIPCFTYWVTPKVLNGLKMNPFRVADAAEYNEIFFNPSLHGYQHSITYAERVFSLVPPGSIVMGDYASYQVLLYFQMTRGMGQGIRLEFLGFTEEPYLDDQLKELGHAAPIYIALWPYHKLYAGENVLRLASRVDQVEPVFLVDKPY